MVCVCGSLLILFAWPFLILWLYIYIYICVYVNVVNVCIIYCLHSWLCILCSNVSCIAVHGLAISKTFAACFILQIIFWAFIIARVAHFHQGRLDHRWELLQARAHGRSGCSPSPAKMMQSSGDIWKRITLRNEDRRGKVVVMHHCAVFRLFSWNCTRKAPFLVPRSFACVYRTWSDDVSTSFHVNLWYLFW